MNKELVEKIEAARAALDELLAELNGQNNEQYFPAEPAKVTRKEMITFQKDRFYRAVRSQRCEGCAFDCDRCPVNKCKSILKDEYVLVPCSVVIRDGRHYVRFAGYDKPAEIIEGL